MSQRIPAIATPALALWAAATVAACVASTTATDDTAPAIDRDAADRGAIVEARDSAPTEQTCDSDAACGDLYCVKGICRRWECEDDGDCGGGPLDQCDENTFRCRTCAADDARCLGVECVDDAGCDDFDRCTDDRCDDNACVNTPRDDCCAADGDCDDGIECTVDRCLQRRCSSVPRDNNCCVDASDCEDLDACTVDTCVEHGCVHRRDATGDCRCTLAFECDDGDRCTEARCDAGGCLYRAVDEAGCCSGDADCDDGDDGTFERCEGFRCVAATGPACSSASDCGPAHDCLDRRCEAGHCAEAVRIEPGCCSTATDCAPAGRCAQATCSDHRCGVSPVDGEYATWSESFDAAGVTLSTLQWSRENDTSGLRWRVGGHRFRSGPGSLYFGTAESVRFSRGRTRGAVTSATITLDADADARLSFALSTEVQPGAASDTLTLFVVPVSAGGEDGAPVAVLGKADLGGSAVAWRVFTAPLTAWRGQRIRVRLAFDTVQGDYDAPRSVVVDDLAVLIDCP